MSRPLSGYVESIRIQGFSFLQFREGALLTFFQIWKIRVRFFFIVHMYVIFGKYKTN